MTGNGLGQGLSDMWRSVLLFLPGALVFVVVLVVGYFVARILRTVVGKALRKAGFDRAVSRGAVGRALQGAKISATELCAKIVFYAVMLFALQLAFGIWGPNPVSDLLTSLIAWLPRAFVAIVIVVVAAAIAGAAHDLIVGALGGIAYGRVLARAAAIAIVALGVIAALDQVQIATSVTQPLLIAVLATVAGVVIVGVGGGLIRPMQYRWETWLERAGTESSVIREHAKAYAEDRRQAEEARKAEEARVEEARKAEEARQAEEARAAEARRAEEARVEETRKVEEKRRDEEARRAQEAWQAEESRLAEERRRADEARQAEEARRESARMAATTQSLTAADRAAAAETQAITAATTGDVHGEVAARAEGEAAATRAADDELIAGARAEAARRAAAAGERRVRTEPGAPPAEETQVIPPPRRVSDTVVDLDAVDEREHFVPGFGPEDDPDGTTVISSDPADTTIINPGSDDTLVIGSGTEAVPDESETERPRRGRRKPPAEGPGA
jgi:hypothetical protein